MKCPMKFNSATMEMDEMSVFHGIIDDEVEHCACERERCAWYIATTQGCAVQHLARTLSAVQSLIKINSKEKL